MASADPPRAHAAARAPLDARWRARAATWKPSTRAMLWSAAAGLLFSLLNALLRALAQGTDPMQAQFLRYLMGLAVLLPVVFARGWRNYKPRTVSGQFWRGAMHTAGLLLWFLALPRIPLADAVAIGFTTPLFIMLGARVFFREPMRWERWLTAAVGFGGVMIVVGPRLSASGGWWHLVMLASAPMFAASFLITKALTRQETAGTILVWQSITVTLLSLPLALLHWAPLSAGQWLAFLVSGVLGSAGHYCLTRSFAAADISATQSVKFLDLVWSALLGLMFFGELPTAATLLGGAVIAGATLWLARREAGLPSRHPAAAAVATPAPAGGPTPPASPAAGAAPAPAHGPAHGPAPTPAQTPAHPPAQTPAPTVGPAGAAPGPRTP